MNNDLISREALLEQVAALKNVADKAESEETRLLLRCLGKGIEGWIKAAPAVDAVEVVRCKDCVCFLKYDPAFKEAPDGADGDCCMRVSYTVDAEHFCAVRNDDFCSLGVKKDVEVSSDV